MNSLKEIQEVLLLFMEEEIIDGEEFAVLWGTFSSKSSISSDIINYFKFLNFKENLMIGKMYTVCALLRNALSCLYSNTRTECFGLEPPILHNYFN